MRLVIQENSNEVGEFVAAYVVKRIKDFQPSSTRPFVLGLPTGSTPLMLYKQLIKLFDAGEVSFQHVVTFNMDECARARLHTTLVYRHPTACHARAREYCAILKTGRMACPTPCPHCLLPRVNLFCGSL